MNGKMLLKVVMLLGLTLLSTSCVNKIILHPLTDGDIKFVPSGQSCVAANDGYWFSQYYLDHVMQIKIERSH